jgi:hypothetical protein
MAFSNADYMVRLGMEYNLTGTEKYHPLTEPSLEIDLESFIVPRMPLGYEGIQDG